jgi:amidase
MKRRDFVTAVTLGLATGSPRFAKNESTDSNEANFMGHGDPPSVPSSLVFATAGEAAAAIRNKQISSVELVQLTFDRIERHNPRINAFAYLLHEDALAAASRADESQSLGKLQGPLHGVPVHVKESFAVAGYPCTWGLPEYKATKAPSNSDAVARLLGAGAVLIGATNVPVGLSDYQSYNEIYGVTNNPWDVKRSPGGSSGGSAAALAAGLGYLSVGSDIGGSIRLPAHFCGIYGHKPTLDLVSMQGHLPGGGRENPGFSTLLSVAGPLARSADDLLTGLRILGGPTDYAAKAWKWDLPASRRDTLRGFRVGYVLDDPYCPVTPETKASMEKAIQALEKAGAKLKAGWPADFKLSELQECYSFHLNAFLYSIEEERDRETIRKEAAKHGEAVPGLASFAEWQKQNLRRLEYRAQWQKTFDDIDVFISPVAFTTAFKRDLSEPIGKRKIKTSQGPRDYWDLGRWIGPAVLTGCPATVAPIGMAGERTPIGIQIMGPFWEDATPITFAKLLGEQIGGFVPPAGYST